MILLIDMDGVVADLLNKWLTTYNNRYNDSLTMGQITNWDASVHAVKCSSEDFYNIINEPGFFENLNVIEHSVEVTKRLQNIGHSLFFVTATPLYSIDAAFYKSKWVNTHFPHIGCNNIIQAHHKHMIKGDILFDDGPINLQNFHGIKVAMDFEYNKNVAVNYRVSNWLDFEKIIHQIMAMRKSNSGAK